MSISMMGVMFSLWACNGSTKADVERLPFFDSPEFTPRWLTPSDVPADFHTVSAFQLKSHHGMDIDETALNGHISVVNFFFIAL